MPRYRKVAIANLRRAYGDEWDEAALRRLALQSFQNLGITLAEFGLRMPRLTLEAAQREVRFEGKQHFEEALARGKGVILVSAHYGNWELIGPRLAAEGYCVNGISRKADDAGMDRLITSVRTRHCRQIPRAQAAREGLAALRRNEVLAIGLDQNTVKGGVFVPFFGHPASTATGPAAFALKTGAAVIPTFCIREPNGDPIVKALPPIYACPTENRAEDIQRLTAEMTQVIETQIRQRPELWMWLHNRWKHQPTVE
jgi:KDO2-lipid IV(A) lauroyltransferase